jgi:hypothetical protein
MSVTKSNSKRLSIFFLGGNRDFDEKLPSNSFSKWLSNIVIFYSRFFANKNRRLEWLSRVCTRYRKTDGKQKDIESDFYANDSPNNNLDSEIQKSCWSCSTTINSTLYSQLHLPSVLAVMADSMPWAENATEA